MTSPTSPDDRAARRAVVQELRQQLQQLERSCRRPAGGDVLFSTGLRRLDQLLPGDGLLPGSLVEWLTADRGEGTATLAIVVAAQVLKHGGALVVVDGRGEFYPPAAQALGVAPERVVVVRPRNPRDTFWALEQALRSSGVAVVYGRVEGGDALVFRRLQLAAETGGSLGFLLRPATGRSQVCWADARLAVRAVPSPGPARPVDWRWRLRVELLHGRGKPGGDMVELELHDEDETHPLHLAPPLARPALSAGATGS
ncbi:MAG: hypothetical protein JNM56_06425 [Planctomycetia bacterium]|nr:hypothetical protein [Planctomycetia bacterium]